MGLYQRVLGNGGSALLTRLTSCRLMMTALKPCSTPLRVNQSLSAAVSPLASRPRPRPLVVYAAKATGLPTIQRPTFIEKLAKETNVTEKNAKVCLKATLDLITKEVTSGNRVSFIG